MSASTTRVDDEWGKCGHVGLGRIVETSRGGRGRRRGEANKNTTRSKRSQGTKAMAEFQKKMHSVLADQHPSMEVIDLTEEKDDEHVVVIGKKRKASTSSSSTPPPSMSTYLSLFVRGLQWLRYYPPWDEGKPIPFYTLCHLMVVTDAHIRKCMHTHQITELQWITQCTEAILWHWIFRVDNRSSTPEDQRLLFRLLDEVWVHPDYHILCFTLHTPPPPVIQDLTVHDRAWWKVLQHYYSTTWMESIPSAISLEALLTCTHPFSKRMTTASSSSSLTFLPGSEIIALQRIRTEWNTLSLSKLGDWISLLRAVHRLYSGAGAQAPAPERLLFLSSRSECRGGGALPPPPQVKPP